ALGAIWAIQAGKDVYVEKPCSHNVWEGRQIVKAARKYNKIVQIGTQSRSSEALREGVQKLHDGIIGEVYMAKGLCYKWRPSIGKADPKDPPPSLDYDLWTGPAELLPYTRHRHPYNWHWFWNYGNGDIGNQGIHEMDKARWGLGVTLPTRIQAMGHKFMFDDSQETPNTMIATFDYPDLKKMLVFEVRHWMTNPELGESERGDNNVGNIFYGSEGYMVMPNYSSYQVFLGKKAEAQPAVSKGGDHFLNFINAVRSRKREDLNAEIEEGHLSSSLCHLANISYRLGRTLDFDPAAEKFVNDAEADKMLTRVYRKGFEVPEIV
ncbi:gfo/Idh/MocA family oxidoreductase, partial [Candidatus Sumerlaeota bacterium]|nr:gfo/Idh/MocA family oxidoreductase [Candidatus Sumerlaeota bacterium]